MIFPIITFEKLSALKTENFLLIEAGNDISAFEKEHLKNAIYVDLDRDLAELPSDAKYGGRHPLPSVSKFSKLLNKLGISKESQIVIYDRNAGANAAARFWWMLTGIGVEKVQVLSGGFQFAKKQGFELTGANIEVIPTKNHFSKEWLHPIVDIDEVKTSIQNQELIILDVRAHERYQGVSEPIDPVAGHIPTAKNIFFKENLNDNGTFKDKESLQRLYQKILQDENKLIVHCGSGVTACHTLLSIVSAGFAMPKLYVGSWSEWCRN